MQIETPSTAYQIYQLSVCPLQCQGVLRVAVVIGVSMEALAETSGVVAYSATRALGGVLVTSIRVGCRRRMEFVHVRLASRVRVCLVQTVVQDDLVADELVVLPRRIRPVRGEGLRGAVDLFHAVEVEVGGIAGDVVRLPQEDLVALVDAVLGAVGADGVGLAIDGTEKACVVLSGVDGVDQSRVVRSNYLRGCEIWCGGSYNTVRVHQLQVAIGGVHIEDSGGSVVFGKVLDDLEQSSSGIVVDDCEEAGRVLVGAISNTIGVGAIFGRVTGAVIAEECDRLLDEHWVARSGCHKSSVHGGVIGHVRVLGGFLELDQVRIVVVSVVPVVHLDIVSSVAVGITQTYL